MTSGESGFSMVEVLVSILILTMAIIPMATMLDSALEASTTSSDYDRARTLANSNLEVIKFDGFDAAETLTSCPVTSPTGFTCSTEISYRKLTFSGGSANFENASSTDAKNMLRVTVMISWKNSSFKESALVAK